MTNTTSELEYLQLSASERLLMAQDIIDSVIADTTELGRRCQRLDSANITTIPWDDICQLFVNR